MSSRISVVIVSYNVADLLRKCLVSVLAQDESVEIIVVDNASSDTSAEMIRSEFPGVKLIVNTANAGFSAANNQGMEMASGDFIFLLNPDTELRPGALHALRQEAEQAGKDCLIGPRLLNSNGSLQVSAWKKPGPSDMIAEALFLHRALGVSQYPAAAFQNRFEAGMLSGAALFFPRSLLSRIGGLDPVLFWMEDADFSTRAREAGAAVIYFPAAEVVHHSGQSSRKNLRRVIANQLLSKLKYYRKHSGLAAMLLASLFCWFHILSRAIVFSITGLFSQAHAEKAGAYWFSAGRFLSYLFTGDQRVT